MVNGANVEEGKNNGTSIVPNLDAISEFRIITNNFDAEYGNFSGGQVNVATKSGTNDIHGSAFEFFRNTDLDARNFFNPAVTGPKGKKTSSAARSADRSRKTSCFSSSITKEPGKQREARLTCRCPRLRTARVMYRICLTRLQPRGERSAV